MRPRYLLSLLMCCMFMTVLPGVASPVTFDELKVQADSAYASEDYHTAVQLYSDIAQRAENAAIYYNLACGYYRMDSMAKAVLWFERAARLDPSDEDIRFNLTMARNKTVDRIIPRHEMFFVSVWKSMMRSHSVTEWAYCALASFFLTLCLALVYMFCSAVWLRKTGFFGAMLTLLLCLLFNVFAYSLRSYNRTHSSAIVMSPAVTVRSTPTKSGTDLFVIHEGTRVEIRDDSMREWAEIQIADGKVGWIEKTSYEAI